MNKDKGYVYLIGEWSNDKNHYKIGVTGGAIESRMKKLQTGNSNELAIVKYFQTKDYFKLEKLLHNHYFKNKIINEWFELNDDEVKSFLSVCEKYQKTIDYLLENNYFYKKQ